MKIVKMIEPDLPDVAVLAKQLGYPMDLQEIESRFEKIAANSNYALFVAKTGENKVVGWIQVNKGAMSLLTANYAEVAALVVDEHCRGQGVGKLLLQNAEKWAKQNQINRLSLSSNVKRTDAHRFYQREGYQVLKLSHFFTKSCD